ncbi:hypothetical protein [Chitinasiproducens palmae]|uniref:hypothetical protein n=1 Tax=Chitinasiproducens palmae TaxID=1770053 RepID=UPI00147FBEB6|nr:hypothetical protein [Chitinasiproducens palmae]
MVPMPSEEITDAALELLVVLALLVVPDEVDVLDEAVEAVVAVLDVDVIVVAIGSHPETDARDRGSGRRRVKRAAVARRRPCRAAARARRMKPEPLDVARGAWRRRWSGPVPVLAVAAAAPRSRPGRPAEADHRFVPRRPKPTRVLR